MAPFVGLWSDRVSGDSLAELQVYQPEGLLLGSAAWNDAPSIFGLLRRLKAVLFRDTSGPGAKLRGYIEPGALANKQADYFDSLIADGTARKEQLYGVGPTEEHSDFEWAIFYEETWLAQLHRRGYKGIGWVCSYGWNYHLLTRQQKERLQAHWEALDLIGRNSYIGWLFNATPPREADLRDTVLAPLQWEGFPIEKWLATEGGYDFWSTGAGDPGYQGEGSPGWKATGLTEFQVANRIIEVCTMLLDVGACGYTIFAHRTQNDAEWSNFYPTPRMLQLWATFSNLKLPEGGDVPITQGDLDTAQAAIRKEILDTHVRLNEAKTNGTFEEMGKEIDAAFSETGQAVNELDKQFAELSKKL